MFPFAWLMGLNPSDAFQFAQYMGEKLVTNEFVVMGKVTGKIATTAFSEHYRAVLNGLRDVVCQLLNCRHDHWLLQEHC